MIRVAAFDKGRKVTIDGKVLLNFATTGYLNLAHEPAVQAAFIEGIKRFGSSYGSSPLSQPQLAVYEQLEQLLAHYYGAEDALLFSSGFSASQAVMRHFVHQGYSVKYGDIVHPALRISHKVTDNHIFASDIVDPIHCTLVLPKETPNSLIRVIDASHGFGILDQMVISHLRNGAIVCGSLNKAFATQAGLVLCSHQQKQELQNQPSYATSSPPSPAACFTLLQALKSGLVKKQQEKLIQLLALVPDNKTKYAFEPCFSVLQLEDKTESLFNNFYDKGVLIWHNEYPKNTGHKLNRAVIHAGLLKEDVELLLKIIISTKHTNTGL